VLAAAWIFLAAPTLTAEWLRSRGEFKQFERLERSAEQNPAGDTHPNRKSATEGFAQDGER